MPEIASGQTPPAVLPSGILPRAQDLPAAPPHHWHWPEYGVELVGTAWNVFVGLSAVVFNFAPGLPGSRWIPDASLRLWVFFFFVSGSC